MKGAGIRTAATAVVLLATTAGPALGAVADRRAPKVPGKIVAAPGAASAGYLTRVAVMTAGSQATFTNADVAMHNVVSTQGLFSSSLAAVGKTVTLSGADRLRPGTYKFFCAPHPNMTGQLIVR